MNDLHINCKLAALITDDQDADRASTRLKSLTKAGPEVGLVNHRKGLFDITLEKVSKSRTESQRANLSVTHSLGHSNNGSICHVQNSVLLEHRSKHGLYHNAWAGIADKAAFFMQLLGKEVNT